MRINYNVSAMLSNNALSTNDDLLSKSLERLSSGLKINHAKDNPAGLAMSKRMNAQIEGLSVANQNYRPDTAGKAGRGRGVQLLSGNWNWRGAFAVDYII